MNHKWKIQCISDDEDKDNLYRLTREGSHGWKLPKNDKLFTTSELCWRIISN